MVTLVYVLEAFFESVEHPLRRPEIGAEMPPMRPVALAAEEPTQRLGGTVGRRKPRQDQDRVPIAATDQPQGRGRGKKRSELEGCPPLGKRAPPGRSNNRIFHRHKGQTIAQSVSFVT